MVYVCWRSVGNRVYRSKLMDPATAIAQCRELMATGAMAVIAAPCKAVRETPEVNLPEDPPRGWEPITAAKANLGFSMS